MKKQLLIIFGIVLVSGCRALPSVQDSYIYLQKSTYENRSWKLVWGDEFSGPQLDTTKWTKVPAGTSNWNMHMSTNPGCYALSNGNLYLRGIMNPDTTEDRRPYLTGGIYSKGKFAFQYGKIEIHAKLECAQGAWPAMWMLSEKEKYGQYPRNGEIDIMEHLNFDSAVYQTVHSYYTLELKQDNNPPHYGTARLNIDTFNTFGLEWYPDKLVFTLNGKETFCYPKLPAADPSQWPFDQPFYVLIDQQLGGSWVGKISPNHLPVQMIVDWVRVYQK